MKKDKKNKFISADDMMWNGVLFVLIKLLVLVLIVSWVYGMFAYKPSKSVVDDPCKTTSSVNNCYVISTVK